MKGVAVITEETDMQKYVEEFISRGRERRSGNEAEGGGELEWKRKKMAVT